MTLCSYCIASKLQQNLTSNTSSRCSSTDYRTMTAWVWDDGIFCVNSWTDYQFHSWFLCIQGHSDMCIGWLGPSCSCHYSCMARTNTHLCLKQHRRATTLQFKPQAKMHFKAVHLLKRREQKSNLVSRCSSSNCQVLGIITGTND